MHFFSKPLILFSCCGSNLHISEPGSRVSPEEQDQLKRVERLRPASLETEEPVSKSEEACDTHPYHCPICFYFFSGASPSAISPVRAPFASGLKRESERGALPTICIQVYTYTRTFMRAYTYSCACARNFKFSCTCTRTHTHQKNIRVIITHVNCGRYRNEPDCVLQAPFVPRLCVRNHGAHPRVSRQL